MPLKLNGFVEFFPDNDERLPNITKRIRDKTQNLNTWVRINGQTGHNIQQPFFAGFVVLIKPSL